MTGLSGKFGNLVFAVAVAVEGFLNEPVHGWRRVSVAAGGLFLMGPGLLFAGIGTVLCLPVFLPWFVRRYKNVSYGR